MAAPAWQKLVGNAFGLYTTTVTVPITNAPTAGNFMFLVVEASHRETSTPTQPTWTDPSGWTLVDTKYNAVADLSGQGYSTWWAIVRIYRKTATASETAPTITRTGNGATLARIWEYSQASFVASQSYSGIDTSASPANTYTSGPADRTVFWTICAPKLEFGFPFTQIDTAGFGNRDNSYVNGTGFWLQSSDYDDFNTVGTINLPRLTQADQNLTNNWFPYVAIAVEIRAPFKAGWVRGHAWG
jgi:hypothetical protein